MPSKRKPVHRELKRRITPVAIKAFRQMKRFAVACTCPPTDWEGEYWKYQPPCEACDKWWAAHSVLHKELDMYPHQWPCVSHPDEQCPYPAGCHAAEHWHRERQGETAQQAIALYLEMEGASRGFKARSA